MRVRGAAILSTAIVLSTARAEGQTRFEWPSTAIDLPTYSVEQCKTALRRTKRDVIIQRLRTTKIWWDTMPVAPSDTELTTFFGSIGRIDQSYDTVQGIRFPEAVAVAQRCGGTRLAGSSAPLFWDGDPRWSDSSDKRTPSGKFPAFSRFFRRYPVADLYLQLYRDAGADADLRAYVDRYLKDVPSDTVATRLAEVLRTVGFNRRWYPLLEEIVEKYAPRVTNRVKRGRFYAYLIVGGTYAIQQMQFDTVTELRAVRRFQKFVDDSLSEAERTALTPIVTLGGADPDMLRDPLFIAAHRPGMSGVQITLDEWSDKLIEDMRRGGLWVKQSLDSLRKSTPAYIAYWRDPKKGGHLVRRSVNDGKDSVDVWDTAAEWGIKGDEAPTIKATAWAGPPVSGPRPTRGRVSLVVFLDASNGCAGGNMSVIPDSAEEMLGMCAPTLIPLRRLMERFPSLEVTVVSRTFGRFLNVVDSMTPAREAELTYQTLVGFGIKNASVAMYDIPFVRLPEPDGRIMQRSADDVNGAAYGCVVCGTMLVSETPEFGSAGGGWGAYLVDENGIVVYTPELTWRGGQDEIYEYVKVLLERNGKVP